MTTYEKLRQEARINERISYLDRDQAKVERQIAELEKRRQALLLKINHEVKQLQQLRKVIVK